MWLSTQSSSPNDKSPPGRIRGSDAAAKSVHDSVRQPVIVKPSGPTVPKTSTCHAAEQRIHTTHS